MLIFHGEVVKPKRETTMAEYGLSLKSCFSQISYWGLECKSRKSGNTWSNRQIWPWSTEWSRAKANRVLPRERPVHNKHPLPTTQEKTTHGYHQMVKTKIRLIALFETKDGKPLYSQQKQVQELIVLRLWTLYCQIQT